MKLNEILVIILPLIIVCINFNSQKWVFVISFILFAFFSPQARLFCVRRFYSIYILVI